MGVAVLTSARTEIWYSFPRVGRVVITGWKPAAYVVVDVSLNVTGRSSSVAIWLIRACPLPAASAGETGATLGRMLTVLPRHCWLVIVLNVVGAV